MCDQTEIPYRDGDVVWVKLGKCFWPGQVCGFDKLDEEITESFKKLPIAAVQFFDEDKYEFVKNLDHISLYNGRRKMDFIKKGFDLFQKSKDPSGFMSKFPEDVKKAELLTGGNPNILSDPHFAPKEKTNHYQGLFNTSKSAKKEKPVQSPRKSNGRRSLPTPAVKSPSRPITHPRFVRGETDHDVRIRDQQKSLLPMPPEENVETPKPKTDMPYKCELCDFTSNRLNVIVLHNKFHTGGGTANQTPAKGSGKNKSKIPKTRVTPSSSNSKPTAKAKTKIADKEPVPQVTSPVASSPKTPTTPKAGDKRKMEIDKEVEKPEEKTVKITKTKAKELPENKTPKTQEKNLEKKSAVLGKRKGAQPSAEKVVKKTKGEEEIREKLLADWDDEDAEQEQKELELLKKKPVKEAEANTTVADITSCFDFDDSKDAILDSELEKRAKKFVESRKIARLTDDKVERLTTESDKDLPVSEKLESKIETTTNQDDFNIAIDSLLEETKVPLVPQLPMSAGILPDVVLDSSNVKDTQTAEYSGGDHDYSSRTGDIVMTEDGEILDINSMPVVMTDDILTEEPTTSQTVQATKIDLVANPNVKNVRSIVVGAAERNMPPSVKSLVKAVRTTTADRSKVVPKTTVVLSPAAKANTITIPAGKMVPIGKSATGAKSTPGGKYIIVQSSGQQSRLTLAPQLASNKAVPTSSQQVGGKVVILSKPQSQQKVLTALSPAQQKALSAGKSLQTPTRIMTSTGQILTPVNPRTGILMGAKVTPITGQQMRMVTPTGKTLMGPKMTMQSLQTKISLPSMHNVRPAGLRMVTTQKPQTKTIYIQAAQSGASPGLMVTKPTVSQLQTKTVVASSQMTARPRLLKSPMTITPTGKPIRTQMQPKILQSRSTLQPRMIVQRARNPNVGIVTGMQPANQVPGLTTQSHVIQKISQPQQVMKIIQQPKRITQPKPLQLAKQLVSEPKQSIQKATIISTLPAANNSMELLTTQPLPPLAPLQTITTLSSDNITLSLPQTSTLSLPTFQTSTIGSSAMTSDELSQAMALLSNSQLGDSQPYVLLTFNEEGNLHQSLMSYDGSDQSGQTLYIDPSSLEGGDLDNMILRIHNPSDSKLVETSTNWLPSTSQDILAAALANTDVFQPEHDNLSCVVDTSSLFSSIPSTILLPSLNRVVSTPANVSETSLTLNQPIMSPLEVTSNATSFRVPGSITTQSLYNPVSEPLLLQSMTCASTITSPSVTLPAFHPSMPLLSEEPLESPISTSLAQDDIDTHHNMGLPILDEENHTASHGQLELPTELRDQTVTFEQTAVDEQTPVSGQSSLGQNEELSYFTEEYLDEGDQNGQLVIVTTNSNEGNEVSYDAPTSQTEMPTHTDLDMPLAGEAVVTDADGVSNSMPLLSDDPADNVADIVAEGDNTHVSKEVASNENELGTLNA